jgi:hypothetical protein
MDFYSTPYDAVVPLLAHLPVGTKFCEPCAGEGHLIRHLEKHGHQCVASYDADPKTQYTHHDATFLLQDDVKDATHIITNPPWARPVLHQLIERCAMIRPTWFLFDSDWMFTKQARLYLDKCHLIVSVGRVKWFGGTVGKDNCAWYLFGQPTSQTRFVNAAPTIPTRRPR